jgi:hypothetical protein
MTYTQPEPVATEPPYEPECRFCDGQGVVTVSEFRDAGGVRYSFPADIEPPAMPCPVCKLGMEVGVEVLA